MIGDSPAARFSDVWFSQPEKPAQATMESAHTDPLSTPPRIQTGIDQGYGRLPASATLPASYDPNELVG